MRVLLGHRGKTFSKPSETLTSQGLSVNPSERAASEEFFHLEYMDGIAGSSRIATRAIAEPLSAAPSLTAYFFGKECHPGNIAAGTRKPFNHACPDRIAPGPCHNDGNTDLGRLLHDLHEWSSRHPPNDINLQMYHWAASSLASPLPRVFGIKGRCSVLPCRPALADPARCLDAVFNNSAVERFINMLSEGPFWASVRG